MLLCGLEIFVILTIGILYVCCDHSRGEKENVTEEPNSKEIKFSWFQKLSDFIAKMNGDLSPKIHSDSCCICCEDINVEVQSSCGHTFCGSCILKFWYSRGKEKINCPLCRRDINMLLINSTKEETLQSEISPSIMQNIEIFNNLYSKKPRNIEEAFASLQSLLGNYFSKMINKDKLSSLAKRALPIFMALVVIIYIITPSTLMPEYASIVIFLENILLIGLTCLCTALKYNDCNKIDSAEEEI